MGVLFVILSAISFGISNAFCQSITADQCFSVDFYRIKINPRLLAINEKLTLYLQQLTFEDKHGLFNK